MRKLMFIALLTVSLAGVFALADARDAGAKYVCPLTGEELPCPACCPAE